MELMKIMEPDSGIDVQRQWLIAFGRRKEDELGCGMLFATVLISPIENTRWSGLFSDCDKTVKINGSVFRNRSGYFTDMIFLHELAHALDHASEGARYRGNPHDECFQDYARKLGVDDAFCSQYVNSEHVLEKRSLSAGLSLRAEDENRYYIIFAIRKRPALLERCALRMVSVICSIYVGWYRGMSHLICI